MPKASKTILSLAFAFVSVATVLAEANPAAPAVYKCELINRPPADENYSAEFFNTTVEVGEKLKLDMNVGELDVFGSCGKANIGKFDMNVDKFTIDEPTASVTIEREFPSPIHLGVMMWEKLKVSKPMNPITVPSGKRQFQLNLKYDHSCQKYIDFDMNLNCIEQ